MPKTRLAFEKQVVKVSRSLASLQVNRQETSLSYVGVSKTGIRKSRELYSGRLHCRFSFTYDPPQELGRSRGTVLVALETLQDKP